MRCLNPESLRGPSARHIHVPLGVYPLEIRCRYPYLYMVGDNDHEARYRS